MSDRMTTGGPQQPGATRAAELGFPPLLCPKCRMNLSSDGVCLQCGHVVSRPDGVFQLVQDGYASSFGAQWREFARTQLDSASGTRISEQRFADVTGWSPALLSGRSVLDVGCGAGRFTEIAIKWGAHVTAVDMSDAVYAARANVAHTEQARFVQADARALPFAPGSFDFVFSIGVAQHTPDPLGFVRSVARMVRPGGRAALWIYERRLSALLSTRYVLRPVTRHLPQKWNRRLASALVQTFFPLAERVDRLPEPIRKVALKTLPIAVYLGQLPLTREAQREWSLLDTLDWYSPRYDRPQTFRDVARTLEEAGAKQVERLATRGVTVSASF
jgi:2-polyprenyl-3-methyl-5-hydroxy-6-metoxy-1,4-benzoquinol methylase